MVKKTTYRRPTTRKVRVKVLSIVLCVVMLAASGYFLWQIFGQAKTTFSLLSDITSAKQQLSDLNTENESLTSQIEKLQNSDYVQSYARSKYLITKQGEQIFQLPSQNGTNSGN